MIEYIKKLKICIKWFQKGLEDLAEEKNKLHTMLDLSEKKFVEAGKSNFTSLYKTLTRY